MSEQVTVVIQKEEKWYVAKCIENSVTSQGKTIEESLINLREALELYYGDSAFAEEILADLIQQGYSGDALLTEFKKSACITHTASLMIFCKVCPGDCFVWNKCFPIKDDKS